MLPVILGRAIRLCQSYAWTFLVISGKTIKLCQNYIKTLLAAWGKTINYAKITHKCF